MQQRERRAKQTGKFIFSKFAHLHGGVDITAATSILLCGAVLLSEGSGEHKLEVLAGRSSRHLHSVHLERGQTAGGGHGVSVVDLLVVECHLLAGGMVLGALMTNIAEVAHQVLRVIHRKSDLHLSVTLVSLVLIHDCNEGHSLLAAVGPPSEESRVMGLFQFP